MPTTRKPTVTSGSSSSAEWFDVESARLAEFWPQAAPFLERVLARGNMMMSLADVRALADKGFWKVWLLWDGRVRGAGVTEVLQQPDGTKVCKARMFSTDADYRDEWLPKLAVVEAAAKANGCAVMKLEGRKGWERLLPGYRLEHVVLTKEL